MYLFIIMLYMFLISLNLMMLFIYVLLNKLTIFMEFKLMNIMSMKLELVLLFDWISILFINIVIMISLMVILYSLEYMNEDYNINRFMLMILMFILSMLLMILSPNLISILIGWDGLGLVSYCLVIYYQSKKSFNSGMVTVLMNRLGDVLMMISIGLMLSIGSWNYIYLEKLNSFVLLLLMITSFTKSAQFPFSSWLPMAMAAPTPVSSLVHSSTLVTAGVYLMIRLNYLFNKDLMYIMMVISLLTMLMSGLSANYEFDFKKIIAMSTLSQLSFMFFCLSMNLIEITLFHLLIHAMFKSMLFMCAGVIIHNMQSDQDIRNISMVLYNLPMISILFNCSTLSLCGIPFMSGYMSKDLILEMYFMSKMNKVVMSILFISVGMTVSYSARLIFYSFVKLPNLMFYNNYSSVSSMMGLSMYLLFFMSIIMGSILNWLLFMMKNIYLPSDLKTKIYLYLLAGFYVGFKISDLDYDSDAIELLFNSLIKFASSMWFLSIFHSKWIYLIFDYLIKFIYLIELGWIEYIFSKKIISIFKLMYKIDYYQKNVLYMILISLIIMIIMMF